MTSAIGLTAAAKARELRPFMLQTNSTRRRKYAGWLLAIGFCVLGLWATGNAAAKPGERSSQKVIIAYSSISGNMAPLWVTYEKGFFRKYGLDVEIVLVEGGSRAAQTLRVWTGELRANGRRRGHPKHS